MFNRKSVFCQVCVYLVLAAFLSTGVFGQIPQGDTGNEYLQGKMDGEASANASGMWFFAGFCGGLIGVLIAYSVKPTPSTALLVGKSQSYINGYIEGYKDKSGSEQGKKALLGWGISCVLTAALYLIIWVIILEDEDDDPYYYYY